VSVELFDVQAGFGGARPGEQPVPPEALAEAMDRLRIGRALVRTAPEDLDRDVGRSNVRLFAAAEADPRLVPCPVVLPAAAEDVPPEPEQVDAFLARGARAVCIRPEPDGWSLAEWASGQLTDALTDCRVPVVCLEKFVALEAAARLAESRPELPLIVAGVGYRAQRTLVALLESFPSVHLSIGSNYAVHGGIEQLVRRAGPERLLFGTGFPEAEPAMALAQLLYADVGDEAKALIGAGNLDRLVRGVTR